AIGKFEAIEPHADKMNRQVITFKDRKMAERFMFGPKDIPSVGKVELTWVNTPLASIRSATQAGPEEGTMAAKSNTNGHQHAVTAETNEVDYDVADGNRL
ncbi:MAG: hypothetical protein L6R37_008434, partial [Teloschistes peruensis]